MRNLATLVGLMLVLGACKVHADPDLDPRVVQALLSGQACVSERMSKDLISLSAYDKLLRRDFDGLAQTAAALRAKPTFAYGPYTDLTLFYGAFAEPNYPISIAFDRKSHLELVEFWEQERPQETLPKLARLEALLGQLGATPAPERGPLIQSARSALSQLQGADPEVEAATLVLSSFDPTLSADSAHTALARLRTTDLDYHAYTCYARRVERLRGLDPWASELMTPADYVALLMRWTNPLKGAPFPVEVDRLLEGLRAVEARFPDSTVIKNYAARLCLTSGRHDEARERLGRLGWALEREVWSCEDLAGVRAALRPTGPPERYPLQPARPCRDYIAYLFFMRQARELLLSRRFAELEAAAQQLRERPQHFSWGEPKLHAFYSGVGAPERDEAGWKRRFATLDAWDRAFPGSPTAQTVRGQSLVKWAYQARGTGYAHKVTPEGHKSLQEGLTQAEQVLSRIKPVDPYASVELISVCMGLGHDPLPAFRQATELDPDCSTAYRAMALFLLPRWHGKPGMVEKFAEQAVERTRARLGMGMYALIADACLGGRGVERETRFDWKRIRQGFADLQQRYPSDMHERRLLQCACYLGLREQARPLFAKLAYAPEVFQQFANWYYWEKWSKDPKEPRPDE